MAQREVAYIEQLAGKPPLTRAKVIFNPAEYSIQKGNQFSSTPLPGLSNPIVSFVNGDADVLTMDLFFDTYTDMESSDVREETGKIAALLEIDPQIHAPPPVLFRWGPLRFKAVIERLTQRFTMFREDGVPVRATLNVTFKEYKTIEDQLNPKPKQSSDWSKRRVVVENDRLCLIAAAEYDDPAVWRVIADANGIENPRLLQPGTEILLPPLK
jgi:Contractile injection system tube protein